MSIFRWETLQEIGAHTLQYEEPVRGKILEVELTSGPKVAVFRAEDVVLYFCHGLTFGGKQAPGGAVSPFSGRNVTTILAHHYFLVAPESAAVVGDILVWKGLGEDTPHSAVLTRPVVREGTNYLDYSSIARTKNGRLPEQEMTLDRLTGDEFGYGDSYNVFRLR